MTALKAWFAGVGAFFTALLAEWTAQSGDKLTARDLIVALAAAVLTAGAVYFVPNKPS